MPLFASDLDNTLLYSKRHLKDSADFVCVEHLDGKEQGFMSRQSIALLRQVKQKNSFIFIPITTRSVAQYRRIEWPEGCAPEMALAANGAILLKQGLPDAIWWEETLALLQPWQDELCRLQDELSATEDFQRCRIVDDSYLFVPCDSPEDAAAAAKHLQEMTPLCAACSGRKVYLLPPGLDKGNALKRLTTRLGSTEVICAGDGAMDLPMLHQADIAFFPIRATQNPKEALHHTDGDSRRTAHWLCPADTSILFSDFILQSIRAMQES